MQDRHRKSRPIAKCVFLAGILSLLACMPALAADPPETFPEVTVYKTPTCGCCGYWVQHLEASGFSVTTHNMNDLSTIKAENGLKPGLTSCHTALVDGYVVEGHVPADLIFRLLKERPDVAGITVPGMPQGSPGMETGNVERYEILTFDADGNTEVYAVRGTEPEPK